MCDKQGALVCLPPGAYVRRNERRIEDVARSPVTIGRRRCRIPRSGLVQRPLSILKRLSMIQDAENGDSLSVALEPEGKRLSRAEFQGLGEMPSELEWFANLDNPRTRRAYRIDVQEFTAFA